MDSKYSEKSTGARKLTLLEKVTHPIMYSLELYENANQMITRNVAEKMRLFLKCTVIFAMFSGKCYETNEGKFIVQLNLI